MRTLVWFRGKDLRVLDHAPLQAAIKGGEVIPLFVLDPYFFEQKRAQAIPHRMQFLLESIASLRENIAHLGSRLLLVSGKSIAVVPELARKWRVDRVVAQRWCEPFARERDERVQTALGEIPFLRFEGETLIAPGKIRTGAGAPFSVFTPFARAHRLMLGTAKMPGAAPRPAPKKLPPLPAGVTCAEALLPDLASLGITENPRVLRGGERAARTRMKAFFTRGAKDYATERDRMDHAGTSRLSQDLKFGTLSVRDVWTAAHHALPAQSRSLLSFTNELLWREFTHHTLWDRPHVLREPFRRDFIGFPYEWDKAKWSAWTSGNTGYPVVDASARQLLSEGFVHNRARMISASFLTKHLLIDYRRGEAHYMAFLTDGDWASNNAGWQWTAGSGCDAQPYFRVFNPVTQGEKLDPAGDYVRAYVPELRKLDAKYIHSPWTAPADALERAGIKLGRDYPLPIVDHKTARQKFLDVATKHLRKR